MTALLEFWRDVDLKPCQGYRPKTLGPAEQSHQASIQGELPDGYERRNVAPAFVTNDEVAAGDMNGGESIDAEGLELDVAFESHRERFNHELPELFGSGAGTGDECKNHEQPTGDRSSPSNGSQDHGDVYPNSVPALAVS